MRLPMGSAHSVLILMGINISCVGRSLVATWRLWSESDARLSATDRVEQKEKPSDPEPIPLSSDDWNERQDRRARDPLDAPQYSFL